MFRKKMFKNKKMKNDENNEEYVNRLRADDYVFCYWLAPGGTTAWLVERGEQLFFFTILSNKQEKFVHTAFREDRIQVETIRQILSLLGFDEVPVYSLYRQMNPASKNYLQGQFDIFEAEIKQMQAKQAEIEAAQKEAMEKKAQEQASKLALNKPMNKPALTVEHGGRSSAEKVDT